MSLELSQKLELFFSMVFFLITLTNRVQLIQSGCKLIAIIKLIVELFSDSNFQRRKNNEQDWKWFGNIICCNASSLFSWVNRGYVMGRHVDQLFLCPLPIIVSQCLTLMWDRFFFFIYLKNAVDTTSECAENYLWGNEDIFQNCVGCQKFSKKMI